MIRTGQAQAAPSRSKPTRAGASRYKQPPELAEFQKEYNAHEYDHLQTIPTACRVYTRFRDDTANGLTAAIIAHLKHNGHFAARVNTQGTYDPRTGKYRTSGARKGMADISAVVNGTPLQIEVKAGRDKPRADQIRVQREYEQAGGRYVFVHNFSEYLATYKDLTK